MTSRSKRKSARGFTLIELMIVVSCISILASIAIPIFGKAKAKARKTEMLEQLNDIVSAATLYYRQNGKWPQGIPANSCYIGNDPASGSPVYYPVQPCGQAGSTMKLDWDAAGDPLQTLSKTVNAPVELTRLRWYVLAFSSIFYVCAWHDFDANGSVAQSCTVLEDMGQTEPYRFDFGWESEE